MCEKILVVCLGNICRSPLGERLLQKLLPEKTVRSAGISAVLDWEAHPTMQAVAAENGLSLAHHKPQQLSAALIDEYDLILVMEDWQRQRALEWQPLAEAKIQLFDRRPVPDPYGYGVPVYRDVYAQMASAAARWAAQLGGRG